jgi:hypothetical protein
MQIVAGRNRNLRALAATVLAVCAWGVTVGPPQADAGGPVSFCGRYLNQAELCHGPFTGGLTLIYAENATDGHAVCIAPVGWNGKYTFPYGWYCAQQQAFWKFAPLYGAAGTENPNSSRKLVGGFYGWLP